MKNARVKCYLKLLYLKGMLWIYAASSERIFKNQCQNNYYSC